ncbi:hypothetical protein QW131_25690 [Roseibium salinum]|nr:hypothetical protein [Roseibium salinum]
MKNQFERHEIAVELDLGTKPVKIRAVKGMVVQVMEKSHFKFSLLVGSGKRRSERDFNLPFGLALIL